ncbi:NACHT domain-containing protein [Saccharothrix coeruleofusca]|uniref:NACHT domain-containing protein n=1 Tax=Saccharothrix coeruleofusca TaxID=33919 RepID=UPI00167100FC|nr:NACHT domain-containing protein [Saccharothrix coeruleofusca]
MAALSGLAFCSAVVTSLVLLLAEGGLERGDKIASVVSMVIAVLSLPVTLYTAYFSVSQARRTAVPEGSADRLDAVADVIADAVRRQWESEEQIRHVHDPFPLPFRWVNAEEDVADHWQNINGTPDDGTPLVLDGRGDHVVDAFRRVPSRRLVVLGEAGSGKTVLTSRFALTLLEERERATGEPVPVIFPLGSWNPALVPLRDWLAEQLVTNYPVLARSDGADGTLAARLLATRRVLPVLDGLDEVTEGLRGEVITRINAEVRPGEQFLLTSRPREFREAVAASDVLTAAAVVRLEALTVDDLDRYLPLTTRKLSGSRTKWHPVLEHLRRSGTGSALAEVLSTPLMVAMARTMFSDTDADPAQLLALDGRDSRTTREVIEDRLLAGFLPAVYSGRASGAGTSRVAGHLRFLAHHLHRSGTHDIAWWRFVLAVPRVVVGVTAGLVITAATWLGTGFAVWAGRWPDPAGQRAWVIATLVAGVVCGAVGGAIVGQGRGIRPSPARLRLRLRGRLRHIAGQLARGLRSKHTAAWLAVWTSGGVLFGLTASVFGRGGNVVPVGLAAGLLAGFGVWSVVAFVHALGAPVEPTEITSPAEFLRTDRRTALRQGLVAGVGGAAVFWLMMRIAFEPAFGVPFDVVFTSGLWFAGFLTLAVLGMLIWALFVTSWGPWLLARLWLPLTGRLPWAVMAFLADAHQRGVLRQAGGVYQFRHARLRDHLAAADRADR